MTGEANPLLDAAIRACCLSTCCATDCLRTKECHAVDLGSEVKRTTAALRAFFDAADRSPEVIEAMARAAYNNTVDSILMHYDVDISEERRDNWRENVRAALRALRAQALGEER